MEPDTRIEAPALAPASRAPRGQGLMEFALILPLVLLTVLGIIEAGRLLAIYSSVSSAAKQAARYGAVSGEVRSGVKFYEDCVGMRDTAKRIGLLQGLRDQDITILFDKGTVTQTIGACATGAITPTLTAGETIKDGYRVVISITTTYRPLVPIVPIPPLPFTFAAARTIFTQIVGPTSTPRPDPDLAITKVGLPPVVAPDGDVTYWITATNRSTVSTANGIRITDTLPISLTQVTTTTLTGIKSAYNWDCTFLTYSPPPQRIVCTRLAPLTPGLSSGFSFVGHAPLFGGVTLTNTATVGSSKPEPPETRANNTYTATNQVLPGADLQVFKTAYTSTVGAGTPVTYTLWATDNGGAASDANNQNPIVLTDTLPAGTLLLSVNGGSGGNSWACTTLAGSPIRVRCTYERSIPVMGLTPNVTLVVQAPLAAGPITNTATLWYGQTIDPLLANNTVSVTTQVVREADLRMFKLGSSSVNGGNNILYSLRVTNNGPSVAQGVTISDSLPVAPGTPVTINPGAGWSNPCTLAGSLVTCVYTPTLNPGQTTSDVLIVVPSPQQTTEISNTGYAWSNMPDPNPANNQAEARTQVTWCDPGRPSATTSTVSASPGEVQADGTATARVTVNLRDLCGAVVDTSVTLNTSRPGQDTITPASGTTSNGQIAFDVKSGTPGTSTYTPVAGGVTLPGVNVTYYGCVSGLGMGRQSNPQSNVDWLFANSTGRDWKLAGISLNWPSGNGRSVQQVIMITNPQTILWSGNNNQSPFNIPGAAAWNNPTDAQRTLANGTLGQLFRIVFDFATTGGYTFDLQSTWDDMNGHQCTINTSASP